MLVEWPGASVLVDTASDLRQQALRHRIARVDAVLYTHHHADHVLGLDDLRIYNWRQGGIQTTKESRTDVINNYLKTGPMTDSRYHWEVTWDCENTLGFTPSLHVKGNVGPNNSSGSGDRTSWTKPGAR